MWADADPQKIIDMIPDDIRPFIIFNVSISVSDTGPFGPHNTVDKMSIVESWVRVCAENRVWCTIQTASGYKHAFPDNHVEDDIYEYFYKNYPNFVGYNFAEQCWGFPSSEHEVERINLFADLIKLGNKYGGYVIVTHNQTINSPQTTGLAFLKRNPTFRSASNDHPENYITCEKYTTSRGFYDVESTTLGAFLTEFAGNYGIRFDDCGWGYFPPREYSSHSFPKALGIVPIIEHALLTGQTVTDGPELTWTDMSITNVGHKTVNGYRSKGFELQQNFINNNIDVFRHFLDGSFRIPSREEVVENTKIAIGNDATSGSRSDMYSSERSLFTGLYAVDGEYSDNNIWTKKTGRYPTIPSIYFGRGYNDGGFDIIVRKSQYSNRWPTIQAKVDEFNELFPEEYTGDIYARRNKNTWVTYNPYMHDPMTVNWNQLPSEDDYKNRVVTEATDPQFFIKVQNNTATGSIPFKYNTCDKMEITHSNYGISVVKELPNKLEVYFNNFADKVSPGINKERDNTIKIYGSTSKPSYTYEDRGGRGSGSVSVQDSWDDNVYTLTVTHNGPVDLVITCSGTATDRLNDYPADPVITTPTTAPVYYGPRQHEFEDFEYKSITSTKATTIAGYTAMGYSTFGNNTNAAMRKEFSVPKSGDYILKVRYSAPNGSRAVYYSMNGAANKVMNFPKTNAASDWQIFEEAVSLQAGKNTIEFTARAGQNQTLYLDHLVIEDPNAPPSDVPVVDEDLLVLETQYYTLMGQRVYVRNVNELKGIYIVRSILSDGSSVSKKILF